MQENRRGKSFWKKIPFLFLYTVTHTRLYLCTQKNVQIYFCTNPDTLQVCAHNESQKQSVLYILFVKFSFSAFVENFSFVSSWLRTSSDRTVCVIHCELSNWTELGKLKALTSFSFPLFGIYIYIYMEFGENYTIRRWNAFR